MKWHQRHQRISMKKEEKRKSKARHQNSEMYMA